MKNNIVRRSAAGILAAAMVLTAASCGSGSQKTKPQQTADQVVENSYRAVEIVPAVPFNYVEQFCSLSNSGNVMISGSSGSEDGIYIGSSDLQDLKKVDLGIEYPESYDIFLRAYPCADGSVVAIADVEDHGNMEKPDYSDPDFDFENFDFDAFEENTKSTYYMVKIDSSGEVKSTATLSGYEKFLNEAEDDGAGSSLYFNAVIPCADGTVLALIDGCDDFITINDDGTFGDTVTMDSDISFYNSCLTADGKLAYFTWEGDDSFINFIDLEQKKDTDEKIAFKDTGINSVNTLLPGSDEYALYISDSTALYGLRSDGSADELVNWIDSDLNGENIRGVIQLPDGDFAIFEQNYDGAGGSVGTFYRLTKRDISELENTVVVTLGLLYTDSAITSKVNEFNKASDKYRIRINDYSKYDEWDEEAQTMTNSAAKQLKLDIIAGNAPDMIYTYDISVVQSLASKGVFTDLYSFLGTNGVPGKDEFVPCALQAGECSGQLLAIAPTFTVSTMAAKSKFVDHDNWTLNELIETYENLPEGTKLFKEYNDRATVFENLTVGCSSFIDMTTNSCSFNSDEFIKILEFCKKFPAESDSPDIATATEEEMSKYYEETDLACRNDKALLSPFNLYNVRSFAQQIHGNFGDDISLVGFPGETGKGGVVSLSNSFSILSNAANKEACWEFISQFFSQDYYKELTVDRNSGLPSLTSNFEELLDSTTERPYTLTESGEKEFYDDSYYIGNSDTPITIDPLTQEQRDYLENYILNCCASNKFAGDTDIRSIVSEEIESFFAGENSAQDTANSIQNRVSILLSEQG